MNREAIDAALFAKLSAIPGFATTSRRLKHWNDVPPDQQPYLCQAMGSQSVSRVTGQPARWTINLKVYMYVTAPETESPGSSINPLIDAVEAALEPAFAAIPVQTLGGLVEFCRISGTIETDEGTLGMQAVAVIPIEILVTN